MCKSLEPASPRVHAAANVRRVFTLNTAAIVKERHLLLTVRNAAARFT